MTKAKYYILFALVLGAVVYQLLLSFNVVPFFFSGQDLFVIILLLIAVTQILISHAVEKISAKGGRLSESFSLSVKPQEDDIELPEMTEFEDRSLIKYVLNIQRYLSHVSGAKETIDKTLVAAAKVTRSRRASVLLFDKRSGELYIHRTLGWDIKELKLTSTTRVKPGEGIAGRVFVDGKPFVMNQPDERGEIETKGKYRTSAFASFPLFAGRRVIGVLNLTEKEGGAYTQNEIDMVSFIVGEVSLDIPPDGVL